MSRPQLNTHPKLRVLPFIVCELSVTHTHTILSHCPNLQVYKAYRAEHCLLLWEDYARTVSDNLGGGIADLAAPPADQWEAAIRGNAPAMEKFVADGIDLDAIGGPDNSTALLEAAERGYTDVVQVSPTPNSQHNTLKFLGCDFWGCPLLERSNFVVLFKVAAQTTH